MKEWGKGHVGGGFFCDEISNVFVCLDGVECVMSWLESGCDGGSKVGWN